eukprot:scaffold2177_cov136-Skeletonema_menzelii.AAC.2
MIVSIRVELKSTVDLRRRRLNIMMRDEGFSNRLLMSVRVEAERRLAEERRSNAEEQRRSSAEQHRTMAEMLGNMQALQLSLQNDSQFSWKKLRSYCSHSKMI